MYIATVLIQNDTALPRKDKYLPIRNGYHILAPPSVLIIPSVPFLLPVNSPVKKATDTQKYQQLARQSISDFPSCL